MNPNIKSIPAIVTLLFAWGVLTTGALFVGCQSTPDRIAYNTIGGIDSAAKLSYDDYVDLVIAKKLTTNDLAEVSRDYNDLHQVLLIASITASQGTNSIVPSNLFTNSLNFANLIIRVTHK